jgi:hypothetical protein
MLTVISGRREIIHPGVFAVPPGFDDVRPLSEPDHGLTGR